ncbi:MAG: signal peptidase I [Anaerolineae bacterium]
MTRRSRRFFGCFLPLTLAAGAVAACGILAFASRIVVARVAVTTAEMAPTLRPGVTVYVDNTAFWARSPARGEVAWVDAPPGRLFRRVVAVPGDTVQVTAGRAMVNGRRVEEPYAHGTGPDSGPLTLDSDMFFVLANDRDEADSRQWGPLSRERVLGSASFMQDPTAGGFQPVEHGAADDAAPGAAP